MTRRRIQVGDVVRLRRGTRFRHGRITVLILSPAGEDGLFLGMEVTRVDGGTPWRQTRRSLGVCLPEEAVSRVVERAARLEPLLQLVASVRALKAS